MVLKYNQFCSRYFKTKTTNCETGKPMALTFHLSVRLRRLRDEFLSLKYAWSRSIAGTTEKRNLSSRSCHLVLAKRQTAETGKPMALTFHPPVRLQRLRDEFLSIECDWFRSIVFTIKKRNLSSRICHLVWMYQKNALKETNGFNFSPTGPFQAFKKWISISSI